MLITLLLFHKFWALMLRDVEELADGVKVAEGEKVAVLDANNLRKQAMNPMTMAVALGEGGGR
ncbi:hypothetical protein Tco_1390286, partial [Tanacetum coccineum]